MRDNQKLYVVTRRDLIPGSQAVQGMHALTEFSMYWPKQYEAWYRESNHLCFLSAATELELGLLCGKLFREGIIHSTFREPDLGMSLTAVAIEATDKASAAVADLSLALKEYAPMGQCPASGF